MPPPEPDPDLQQELIWLDAVTLLRARRRPGVLVTLASVRGHCPRDAGAKMVVAAHATWGTIGGGNLEATAVARARALLADRPPASQGAPELLQVSLSDRAPARHGVQCCGGEVTVLLEPLAVVPAVAVFGVGHVGLELARLLARHDLELHLVDSRAGQLEPGRLAPVLSGPARVHVHHAPVPELVLGQVPEGTHVLVMTHDHAEDAALCDAALRCGHLGTIGLIGSAAKSRRFRQRLAAEGHDTAALDRITTPIGLPAVTGKDPATLALSVAAALVATFQAERAGDAAGSRLRR